MQSEAKSSPQSKHQGPSGVEPLCERIGAATCLALLGQLLLVSISREGAGGEPLVLTHLLLLVCLPLLGVP